MKKKINILLVVLISISTISCKHNDDHHDGDHDHEKHEDHGKKDEHGDHNSVTLTSAQLKAMNIEIIEVKTQVLNIGVKVTGRLELAPQDKADISPLIGGVIRSIKVIEGDYVKQGQTLATLQHPNIIELQQDYASSINDLVYLKEDYKRQQKLYDEKIGSGKEFQKVKSNYLNQVIKVKSLKIKLEMLDLDVNSISKGNIIKDIRITAPMNGIISLVQTNIGSYASPLTKLFEVVNNDKLHADFRVFENDINKVAVGQKVRFTTTGLSNREFEGEVHAISPVLEENPKALHVHADISNDKKSLIPGMYIQGEIISENFSALAVPYKSIVTEADKYFVFIVKQSNSNQTIFHKTEIIKGFESNEMIEIKFTQKIQAELQIANDGYYLLAEMGKAENEHTH